MRVCYSDAFGWLWFCSAYVETRSPSITVAIMRLQHVIKQCYFLITWHSALQCMLISQFSRIWVTSNVSASYLRLWNTAFTLGHHSPCAAVFSVIDKNWTLFSGCARRQLPHCIISLGRHTCGAFLCTGQCSEYPPAHVGRAKVKNILHYRLLLPMSL
jgi:hypothetical protein